MTNPEFLIRFPEFAGAEEEFPGLVDACLSEAKLAVSSVWDKKRDQVIGLEAAHRLAITPFGRTAKLSSSAGKSTYGTQLSKLRVAFACALNRQG